MRRSIVLLLLLLFSPALAAADQVSTSVRSEATGTTRAEAIRNALIEALKQVEGVSLDVQQQHERNLKRAFSTGGVNTTELNKKGNAMVREATKGRIQSYQVLQADRLSAHQWQVTVLANFIKYKTPGHVPQNRRMIAVLPFRVKEARNHEAARQLTQEIVTQLTQSRRFTVLDRDYIEEYLQEKRLLLSDDTPSSELIKLGQVLGVDYLLAGTLSDLSQRRSTRVIETIGESVTRSNASLRVEYRIIVMATRQIKWADTVTLRWGDGQISRYAGGGSSGSVRQALLNTASKDIVRQALANIYPIRVVARTSAGEVVINQGGKSLSVGDYFDVYSTGEEIVDPYTGESLGQAESWVATIKVRRVTAKLSYASVVKGTSSAVTSGSICRRSTHRTAVSRPVSRRPKPAASNRNDVIVSDDGGVVLPFDR